MENFTAQASRAPPKDYSPSAQSIADTPDGLTIRKSWISVSSSIKLIRYRGIRTAVHNIEFGEKRPCRVLETYGFDSVIVIERKLFKKLRYLPKFFKIY